MGSDEKENAGPRRAAFLDDDEHFLETIRAWQKANGARPLATTSPEECLGWIRGNEVDVVVSDLRMPGLEGVEFLEEARRLSPTTELYLFTGYSPTHDESERLRRVHAKELSKTSDFESLLESLSSSSGDPLTRQLVLLQARLERAQGVNREWSADLLDQLKAIPDLGESWVSSAAASDDSVFTVEELIRDIEELTARGREHIRLWNQAKRTLRKLGRHL